MGQELACTLRYRKRKLAGTALLETDCLLFRGEAATAGAGRLKVPFKDLASVSASGGILQLEFPGGPAALELGPAAEKWAHKILNPPSRAHKLGVKPSGAVRLAGELEPAFLEELRGCGVEWPPADLAGGNPDGGSKAGVGKADLVFFAAAVAGDLLRVPEFRAWLKPTGALWVVYPKGIAAIREIQVLEAGRAAGWKDTKVASFSATHTALRFVIPVTER